MKKILLTIEQKFIFTSFRVPIHSNGQSKKWQKFEESDYQLVKNKNKLSEQQKKFHKSFEPTQNELDNTVLTSVFQHSIKLISDFNQFFRY